MRILKKIERNIKGKILTDEPLSAHTTYKVGGEVEVLACPVDSTEAAWLYRFARRESIPLTILGAGSNVIAPDEGIEGMVIKLDTPTARIDFRDGRVVADAGVSVIGLAKAAAGKGFRGLKPIAGVPGTVGGAVLMNAKVVEDDTASLIERVEVLTSAGKSRTFGREELSFGYRESIFQGADWLITRAEFRLEPADPETALKDVVEEWEKWRSNFPLDPPNAGSVFKRPHGDYPGRLIEEAGCKGMRIGGAEVSRRHSNFILNVGNATASNILELISQVRRRVYDETGVYLELEQIPLSSRPRAR